MKLKSDKYTTGQKALTHKEFDKLTEVISDLQDELLIKMSVALAIRREDMCIPTKKKTSKNFDPRRGIKINNIDMDNKTLIFYESKKGMSRSVNLPDSIVVLIKKYLKTIPKRENLFSYTGRTAYRRFNHWCRIAGIYERPFHALRATCIKFCRDAGWSDEQVSALTGDSIGVIQQHYRTPTAQEMVDVTNQKPII